jgi:hypothetical protein
MNVIAIKLDILNVEQRFEICIENQDLLISIGDPEKITYE